MKYGGKMDKLLYYILLMIVIIIVLPFLIVGSCKLKKDAVPPDKTESLKIRVFNTKENTIYEIPLEEYIECVVAAEMPAEFEPEALKAQAVAARTYAYGRMMKIYSPGDDTHNGADICTDSTHCQAWVSQTDAMKKWGMLEAVKYWNKIERSVYETRDKLIIYNGNVINPVFHSNSGGRTENAEDVWIGNGEPYLKSVASNGEEACSEFISTVNIEASDLLSVLKKEYPDIKVNEKDIFGDIKILDYTAGDRVKTLRIGNVELKGTDFRRIFSLRSANFDIEKVNDKTLKITVFGNGHGVGMSQWGANYLAKSGGTCEEILKYYYAGVELTTINAYETAKDSK